MIFEDPDRPLPAPSSADLRRPTLGQVGHTQIAELDRLAALGNCKWPLLQLIALAGYDPEVHRSEKSVGAYIYFITRPEILGILETWATENRHASSLLRLSASLGVRPDLIRAIRPFNEAQQASRELRGTLTDEPLNGMLASRRAVPRPDQGLAHWLEQLRTFLLISGLQLLEAGARQDRFLGEACTAVRKACDRDSSDQVHWLRLIASQTSDFADFAADLKYRCTTTRPAEASKDKVTLPPAARHLFSTLRRLACGGAWWDPKSIDATAKAARSAVFGIRDPAEAVAARPPAPPPFLPGFQGVVSVGPGDDQHGRFVTYEGRRNTTPTESRKHGQQILLGSVEDGLYLPATWHRLTAIECRSMADRIDALLRSESLVERVGAALTLVAWVAARGMFDAEVIACGTSLNDDWTLDIEAGVLRRRPPRFQRGATATSFGPDAASWLGPLASHLEVDLCAEAATALREATITTSQAANVGDLWASLSPNTPLSKWFDDEFSDSANLKRLSGPVTAGALGATVFSSSQDAVFAQLLSSQTRTALPASCAYGSYRHSACEEAWAAAPFAKLALLRRPLDGSTYSLNAAGSEFDADLSRIAQALNNLIDRYAAAASDPQRWVEAHNLLTCLVVIALLASTGARPVNSPFETRDWLDLVNALIYVEDKRSGPTTGARVCVLSQVAVQLLELVYLPHLRALEVMFLPTCPRMASAINQSLLDKGDGDRALPFLFFLRPAPDFSWIEVTETQLGAHCGIDWPLPWNLFRHLHAIHLVRGGLHPEIVDALLAHGDRGAESHGDHSMRVPHDDLEAARPYVEQLQVEFGLRVPHSAPALPARLGPGYPDLAEDAARPFGARARAVARERSHDAARRRAHLEITEAIGTRPPSALSAEDWQAIGRQMLFNGQSMPHPSASLRFDVFEELMAEAWNQDRALVNLKRHFRPVPEPTPIFAASLLTAGPLIDSASDAFRMATGRFDIGRDQPGPSVAAVLGAIEILLSCRLAHPATLLDVAHLRRNVRLIRFDGQYWLERANADVWHDGKPVMRTALNSRAARWIGIALSSTRRDMKAAAIPEALRDWARLHAGGAITLGAALRYLCELRQQLNSWELPGVQAAHLSGRQVMSALPHHDWYRLSRMQAPAMTEPPAEVPEFDDSEALVVPVGDPGQVFKDSTTAERCATLLDGISRAFRKDDADVSETIAEIRRLTAASGFALGDAPQVLAHFSCVLLTRKRRTGKKIRLRMPTARRYWYSLVGPFVDLAHDRCLIDEDEESIQEFYEDIVHWWDTHLEDAESASTRNESDDIDGMNEDAARQDRSFDSARRTVSQLKDFHDFATKAYGVEEMDWGGIDLGARLAVGRPALILESEVEAVLKALVGEADITTVPDERLSIAFVLIVCFRFGLRVGEAVGLYRDDWADCEGAVVVLVRSNAVRGLKTPRSRRQVPLVEGLGPIVPVVVTEIIRRWELVHTAGASAPLLPGVTSDSYVTRKASISSALRNLLKQVTRSDASRIHGLRHSYACRLLALLIGVSPGKGLNFDNASTVHARRLLLGTAMLDRRSIWTIARCLGHASPATTLRCYLHALELMTSPPHADVIWDGTGVDHGAFIDLDALAADSLYGLRPTVPDEDPLPPESLPLRRIRLLTLVAAGYKPDRAMLSSKLTPEELDALIDQLEQLPGHGSKGREILTSSAMLQTISLARWYALATLVAHSEPVQLFGDHDLSSVPIGTRRHLVLHLQRHFSAAKKFIAALGLQPIDVRLVTVPKLHPTTSGWVESSSLSTYVDRDASASKDFRVDPVFHGDPPEPVTHRAALIPSTDPSRRVQTTQELLVLWAVMRVRPAPAATNATLQSSESSSNSAS